MLCLARENPRWGYPRIAENGDAERFGRTIRAECRDWPLILGRGHLERVLSAYIAHYNRERPHRALALHPPESAGRSVHRTSAQSNAHLLGGLIHEYHQAGHEHAF